MDATPHNDPPERKQDHPRRLFRARSNRLIGGVAGGLGRYFGIDPIIFRIAFVALAFFGGTGLFLYLAMWLFVPVERRPGEPPPPRGAMGRRAALIAGLALLAWGGLVLLEHLIHVLFGRNWPAAAVLGTPALIAIAAGGGWLWLRRRAESGNRPSPDACVLRRMLYVLAWTAALVTLGLVSALAAGIGAGVAIAALGTALGLAIAVSAFGRGARWLIVPTLTVLFSAGVVFAAHADLHGGFGDRQYRPLSLAELQSAYKLGAGRLELDLRGIGFPAADRTLNLKLGAGELAVIVPPDVCVATEAQVGGGYVRALEREEGGLDLTWRNEPVSPAGVPRLLIHAEVGLGTLLVSHRPLEQQEGFGREAYGANDACFESAAGAQSGSGR
jgi:phage shock protein PspC (stress-responsive transcriptional regulator)